VNWAGAVLIVSSIIAGSNRTLPQQIARALVEEVHPDLGEDAERRDMDRLDLVVGQDPRRLVPHPGLADRALLGQDMALVAGSAACPPAGSGSQRRVGQPGERRIEREVQGRIELISHRTGPSTSS